MARIKYKEAVGLDVKKGRPSVGKKPNKEKLEKLYIEESKSIRDIAEILACSKDMIYRALLEYGIKTRGHTRESRLSKYSLKNLHEIVSKEGLRGAARNLGVGYTTLRAYLERREK